MCEGMPFCLISLILADSGHALGAACRQKVSLYGGVIASSVTITFTYYTILITFVILITIITTTATTGVLLHHRNNVLAHSLL